MIDTLLTFLAMALLLCGAVVVLIGSIGLLNLPDGLSRLHAAGVIDTLGTWLILLGLLLLSPSLVIGFKIILIVVLMFFISPVNSHGLASMALKSGMGSVSNANSDRQK